MNGLVRWAVTTSLATIELVLTKTLDGVRVANVMLASPGPEQRQLAAAPSSAPASSEAGARPGWRSPERGNLDATSAALRARAAARPVPGTLVARAEPVGAAEVTSEAASRTRPPRRRVVVASASAGSLAGRVVPEPEAPRPIASETPAIADPAAIAESQTWYMNMLLPPEGQGIYEQTDAVTHWYKRNLRIFTNLNRVVKPGGGDRVLLLIGSGHLYILNDFVKSAPYACWVDPLEVLGSAGH